MDFRGKLKPTSTICKLWIKHHRLGGIVGNVQFNQTTPGVYTTDVLMADQISHLKGIADVQLEAAAVPAPVVPLPITTHSRRAEEILESKPVDEMETIDPEIKAALEAPAVMPRLDTQGHVDMPSKQGQAEPLVPGAPSSPLTTSPTPKTEPEKPAMTRLEQVRAKHQQHFGKHGRHHR